MVQGEHVSRATAAFSLIEMLTVVALLSFIIIGLMAMFNQTQRTWKASMTQKDVLESGRMTTDMLKQDFLAATPSGLPGVVNFSVANHLLYSAAPAMPLLQQAYPQTTAPSEKRNNLLQEVFLLSRENKRWRGIGFRVDSPDVEMIRSGVGTLYRMEITNAQPTSAMFQYFSTSSVAQASFTPLIDGVVHFVVRSFDTNGFLISNGLLQTTNLGGTYGFLQPLGAPIPPHTNIVLGTRQLEDAWPGRFLNKAVPAYVEVELGILEARVAERARAIPNAAVRTAYLQKQLGSVHLFRQRIPIRNVDPEAYQ